ncbi:CDP-glycerol glycerophosphotransferase family protein [Nonomuraea sp. NPDC055795]
MPAPRPVRPQDAGPMGCPKISIVVPFYNVERYLRPCLDSLARQTLTDIEVVMVDDGSPDGSAVIAKEYAARDPRFLLIQQENQGLGPARNTGARRAGGQYLAFADSDDLLPPQAYDLLVGSLESTGSDLASGDVRTFGTTGVHRSWLPRGLFHADRPRTHVRRDNRLLWDRSAWNKVFRRTFWDANGFAFPPGLYEDVPVTMRAHVAAGTADVVRDVVYYYRQRDGAGAPSITQRDGDLANLRGRVGGLHEVAGFFAAEAPELKNAFDRTALIGDVRRVIEALPAACPEDRGTLLDLATGYLDKVDAAVIAELGPAHRLKFSLAADGDLDALLRALEAERRAKEPAGIVRRGLLRRRLLHDLPEAGARLPEPLLRAERDLSLRAKVDAAAWHGETLRIRGHAYIERLEMAERDGLRAWLQDTRSGTRVTLKLARERRPDVTAASGQSHVCLDWAGFTAEVPAGVLKTGERWAPGTWELRVAVTAGGQAREGLAGLSPDVAERRPAARAVGERCWVRPLFTEAGRFQIRVRKPKAVVTACRPAEDGLLVEGWIRRLASAEPPVLVATRRRDGAEVRRPAAFTAEDERHQAFTVTIPAAELADPPRSPLADPMLWEGEDSRWSLSFEAGEEQLPLAADDLPPVRVRAGEQEAVLTQTGYGSADLVLRPHRPVLAEAHWTAAGELVVTGHHFGGPAGLRAGRRIEGDAHPFEVTWDDDRFRAVLNPAGMLPGAWELLDDRGGPVVTDGAAPLPAARVHDDLEFAPRSCDTGALLLNVRQALADDERGRYARRLLEQEVYPALRREPVRECVVFDSWEGKQCSDSPRAVFEALAGSGLDLVWVRREGRFAVPVGARSVVRGSREHVEALATARYIVANSTLPAWFRKRPGQVYAQTWHGTPLKRIGFDMDAVRSVEGAAYLERFAADVRQWDLLVSPNAFSTPIMRRAFRFEGEVVECGYPRNDALLAPGADERGRAVRRALGVPDGKRAVLYAPTWRDDEHAHGRYRFDLRIDLDRARAELGEDTVLLVRGHSNVTAGIPAGDGFVVDVTRHPDVAELYLAADALVTDYSSVMFDFAVTGKPMVFFTYDLERYRDELRGFYFDLEAGAPGPLVRDSEALIGALADLDAVAAGYAAAYRGFRERFCELDDGGATARVVSRIFGRVLRDGQEAAWTFSSSSRE